jgi:hypothetical protein
MSDYKTDLNRFLDDLRDLARFREADEHERLAAIRMRIDKTVKSLLKGGLFGETEQEVRQTIINRLKELGKLPADFIYPGKSSS